jgi:hypothetical protein
MYNAGKVLIGIVIFLGLISFPFWYNHGKASPPPDLKLDTPVIEQLQEKKCVEPTDYMYASHMQLLDEWRYKVVRDAERVYVATDGQEYTISLSNTCLNCHSNKKEFCDRCHEYVGNVSPNCWNCHIAPEENR